MLRICTFSKRYAKLIIRKLVNFDLGLVVKLYSWLFKILIISGGIAMKNKIDLYLISGFLGSGKTTFLKKMLERNSDKRVGVIVNEFGSVGIDGKVLHQEESKLIEINNGSIFCACLKGEFVKTLVAFLEQPIDVLFIEASGMADPSSMKNLLEQLTVLLDNKDEINQEYEYKGSICLVDAVRFMEFCEVFQPTINQVKKSSLIVVNKVDEVSEEEVETLHKKLSELNKYAFLYDTTFGDIPIELIESKVTPEGVLEEETTNTVKNRPKSYTLEMKDTYDLATMRKFSLALSEKTLRFKGFFKTTDGKIGHADCVGDYIKISEVTDENIAIDNVYEIVLIGKSSAEYDETIKELWQKFFKETELYFS
jgi:G3E family GTPase